MIRTLIAVLISQLWNLCPAGQQAAVQGDLIVEGVVVSDFRSPNMAFAQNLSSAMLDTEPCRATCYVQSVDGSRGIRLMFANRMENELRRGDRVRLNLSGCTLVHTARPDAVTVSGFTAAGVLQCEAGTVEAKVRPLASLTDADLYTYVSIPELEVIFKAGSWANVHEEFAPWCEELHAGVKYVVQNRMDGWATLLRGGDGRLIYMLVSLLCPWRRSGETLPSGSGPVRGVLVSESVPRYGGSLGPYQIRPVFREDIGIQDGKSSWKTLTGWTTPAGRDNSLDFETAGKMGPLNKKPYANDKICSDAGTAAGLFWTDTGADIYVMSGYDDKGVARRGFVTNGAIMFQCKAAQWFTWDEAGKVDDSRAFWFGFSTRKIKATELQFNIEWSAGTKDGNKCWYFPTDWKLEYSVDGTHFALVKETVTQREAFPLVSVPWNDARIKGSNHNFVMRPAYDTGIGPCQRSFALPKECIGCKKVLLRLSPASDWVAKPRVKSSTPTRASRAQQAEAGKRPVWIRFDTIQIDYR